MLVPVKLTGDQGVNLVVGVSLVFLVIGNDSQVSNETTDIYTII